MTWSNHFQRKVFHFLQSFFNQFSVRGQYISKIFLSFKKQDSLINLIIKAFACTIVLTKGIIGEQNLVFFQVSCHRIRPVQHRQRQKLQFTFAQRKHVAFFDSNKIKNIAIMLNSLIFTLRSNEKHGIRCHFGKFWQSAGMIRLNMINYDIINFRRVNHFTYLIDIFISKWSFNSINQTNFFVNDKVRVICHSPGGNVAMKISRRPVDNTHIINIFC